MLISLMRMHSFPPSLLLYAGIAVAVLMFVNLMTRRIPVIGTLLRMAIWVVLAVLLIGAIQQRSLFDPYFARLTRFLNLDNADEQQVAGKELRIPLARDGHSGSARGSTASNAVYSSIVAPP